MVITEKNAPSMPRKSAAIDGLDELFELNRLFLITVSEDLRAGSNRFGLPPSAARALRRGSTDIVERLAEFPQALFELDLAEPISHGVMDPAKPLPDPAYRAINLTLLVSAWNLSRKNDYAARLFLRLSDAEIRRLRTMPLSDLPRLSMRDHLVGCAFREPAWLWYELLTEKRPEERRRLLLLGLQPRVEVNPRSSIAMKLSATI